MVSVLRQHGLRVVIYCDDHDPPHVHVYGDAEIKIILGDSPDTVQVVKFAQTKLTESRRAARIVKANHAFLLKRWEGLHD